MNIPSSYQSLTLKQLIELHNLKKDGAISDLDKLVKKLSILTGKPEERISRLSLENIKLLNSQTSYLDFPPAQLKVSKWLRVGFKLYMPALEMSEFTVAQMADFVSIYERNEKDHVACANELLAIIYKRVLLFKESKYDPSGHAKLSEALLKKRVGKTLGTLFFYANAWKKSRQTMQDKSQEAARIIQETMKEIQADDGFMSSLRTGAGSTISNYAPSPLT